MSYSSNLGSYAMSGLLGSASPITTLRPAGLLLLIENRYILLTNYEHLTQI